MLVNDHTNAAARLLEAAIIGARMADGHPEAEIRADAALWDDLRPSLEKITSNPKLMRDMLTALESPEVKTLVLRFRDQMKYTDRFDINPDQTLKGTYSRVVDRTKPDSGFNRSLWQRLMHVISDTNGAVECSKAGAIIKHPTTGLVLHTFPNECEFFKVDNMAVFYLQAIVYAKDAQGRQLCETTAGAFAATTPGTPKADCEAQGRRPRRKANFNYQWPNALITSLIVAQGGDAFSRHARHPAASARSRRPQALNRVLFLAPRPAALNDTSHPARDRSARLAEKHAGTMPVWERDSFYDQIPPDPAGVRRLGSGADLRRHHLGVSQALVERGVDRHPAHEPERAELHVGRERGQLRAARHGVLRG